MTTIIKRCRGEKTRGIRAIDGFRNKLMIPDSEIPKCPEFEVKSKIGKIFKKHNPLEEYSVKIYEIDPYFYEHYKEKYKLIKMGVNIYYLELIFISLSAFQQQKLMKNDILTETLFLKKKDKNYQKKLGFKFIRINTSNVKYGYDLDYEVGNIEAFIDELKNQKIKKLEKQLIKEKEIREKVEKEMGEKLEKELKDKSKELKNLRIIIKNYKCKR